MRCSRLLIRRPPRHVVSTVAISVGTLEWGKASGVTIPETEPTLIFGTSALPPLFRPGRTCVLCSTEKKIRRNRGRVHGTFLPGTDARMG